MILGQHTLKITMVAFGWKRAAIASWALIALLLITLTYHHGETVVKPALNRIAYWANLAPPPEEQTFQPETLDRLIYPQTPEQIAGRLTTSAKWEDQMNKWFADIGRDVKKAKHCNDLVTENKTFTGTYTSNMTAFQAYISIARGEKGKGRLEGYSSEVPAQTWVYHLMARKKHVQTVCETGFNAGHSAYVWLSSHPTSRLFSFDLGIHPYAHSMAEYMTTMFPGRVTVTFGDSTKSLPVFKQTIKISEPDFKCDIIIVDGGHTYEVQKADVDNFRSLGIPGHSLVVIDDYPSSMFNFEAIGKVWEDAKKAGYIRELFRCTTGGRGFTIGYFV